MKTELFKTGTSKTIFICEALMDSPGSDDKVYNKINLIIVLRDENNKAVKTVRYFLDVPVAKVIFHDLWHLALKENYDEYKKSGGNERAVQISPTELGYRISILNSTGGDAKDRLYFDLTNFQIRQLARELLDYLRLHELAFVISTMGKQTMTLTQ